MKAGGVPLVARRPVQQPCGQTADATTSPAEAVEASPTAPGGRTPWHTAMGAALAEAHRAIPHGDVPVGAVVLDATGAVVARAHNARHLTADPTAHAEILALRLAAQALGTWRLDGCTLVVTLEPCTMCAGALVAARVKRLVLGAWDPKAGAVSSLWDVVRDARLNHRVEVTAGVRAAECEAILQEFFAARR